LRAADHVGGYETRDPILVAALDERVHLPRQKLAVQDLDPGRRHHRFLRCSAAVESTASSSTVRTTDVGAVTRTGRPGK
jgi:hypothetical protein